MSKKRRQQQHVQKLRETLCAYIVAYNQRRDHHVFEAKIVSNITKRRQEYQRRFEQIYGHVDYDLPVLFATPKQKY